ncbi:hypothetical protein KI387_020247, partial [Taxus chinensis]
QELQSLHPDDSHVVVLKHGVWRVKGIIQVSRSIGDVYLKKSEFNREPLYQKFRLPEPLHVPVLTADAFNYVSRSIGDVYLKKSEFNREPLYQKFRLPEPLHVPVLTAEPSIYVHKLQQHDQFLLFASDGLWEHLTNEETVDIVHNHPHG